MMGGGLSSDPYGSLLKFKKKFTQGPLRDFYVGKHFNPALYADICKLAGVSSSIDGYFLGYRQEGGAQIG